MGFLVSLRAANDDIILPVASFGDKQLPCARDIKFIIRDEGA